MSEDSVYFKVEELGHVYTKIDIVYVVDEHLNKTGEIVTCSLPYVSERFKKSTKRAVHNGINGKEVIRLCKYFDYYFPSPSNEKLIDKYRDVKPYNRYRLEFLLTHDDFKLQFVTANC